MGGTATLRHPPAQSTPPEPERKRRRRIRWLWIAGWVGFAATGGALALVVAALDTYDPEAMRDAARRAIAPVAEALDGDRYVPDFGPDLPAGAATSADALRAALAAALPGHAVTVDALENPAQVRSRFPFAYQDLSRPELGQLRARLKLDDVIRGAADETEMFRRVTSHIRSLAPHPELPSPGGPLREDAFSILDGVDHGQWLWCHPYSLVLLQALVSLGHHARLVAAGFDDVNEHAVVEVWSEQWGRWILLDTDYDLYYTRDGAPLDVYQLHRTAHHLDQGYREWLFATGREDPRGDDVGWSAPGAPDDPLRVFARAHPELTAGIEPVRGTVDDPRIPAMLAKSATGKHIEAYRGVALTMRDDFLTETYTIGHPRRSLRLAFPDAPPLYLRHSDDVLSARLADFYWTLDTVTLAFAPGAEPGAVRVTLGTYTPGFAKFRVRIDGGPPIETRDPVQVWRLSPGPHAFEAAAVNQLGVQGRTASARVTVGAPEGELRAGSTATAPRAE